MAGRHKTEDNNRKQPKKGARDGRIVLKNSPMLGRVNIEVYN
jgi:hypothetical protein